ncbi:hypothetical protein B7P43_G07281 [Cryptotermes secundus]|uniref:Uncharacterized protein n=2 Tax=Cryptotermes secundus TaxID=105785 RepID=A0A2J7QMZ4_9NEOP|nr:hypothetical protein B7P43_G07281 [Cryptotermes secundus]
MCISDVFPSSQPSAEHHYQHQTNAQGSPPPDGQTLSSQVMPGASQTPNQQYTPENTIMPAVDQQALLLHPRLSQQNSLEKDSGPQTIADLQQKLLQLTSQPSSERVLTGTPPSHPATPQVQLTYDTYMQTLQQKLASISMPGAHTLGPLSPQSTLHATVASGSAVPTAVDVLSQPLLPTGVMGIDGIGVLPADQPIIVQPLAVLGPVQQMSVTPLMDSSNNSSGIMSPSQIASKEEVQRQLRPRPAAIDLHDLEQELAKIHTGHRHVALNQAPSGAQLGPTAATQVIPQPMAQLLTTVPLAVPTPVQPTNTPIFPTAVLQPNLVSVTDISVNTTPDEANVMGNRCESLENLTRSLDYNKETAEDIQEFVISHTVTSESETQTADPYTVELPASDSNHAEKDEGFVRGKPQEKMKLLDEKQQEQKLQQGKKADDSLTIKRISRFQVSVVQEDVAVSGSSQASWNSDTSDKPITTTAVKRGRFSVVTHPDHIAPVMPRIPDNGISIMPPTSDKRFPAVPPIHGKRLSSVSPISDTRITATPPLPDSRTSASPPVYDDVPECQLTESDCALKILHKAKPTSSLSSGTGFVSAASDSDYKFTSASIPSARNMVATNVTAEQLPTVPVSSADANIRPCSKSEQQATFQLCTPPISRKRQLPLTPAVDGTWNSLVSHCGLETGVSDSESEEECIPHSLMNNDEFRLLIRRQELEMEALKQKHHKEIVAFQHQHFMQQLNINTGKFQTFQQISTSSAPTISNPAAAAMYPIMYQPMTPAYAAVSAPRAPGASLEDYSMYSTAPQSPTFEASGCPSVTNTPPQSVNGKPHSMTSEEIFHLTGAANQVLTRPVVINTANGPQFLSNHLGVVNPNGTVIGYNPTVFHQGNSLGSPNTAVNGCLGAEPGNIVTVRPDLGQMPPSGGIHYTEPLWVPVSSANQANPHMIPNSSQCFNQYPVGSFSGLPGFHHVSTVTGSLLQVAHGPSPQLSASVGTPGYYLQPDVTPHLQTGMRFVYETQLPHDGTVCPTPQPSTPVHSAGPASPSDHLLAGQNEKHHSRTGEQGEES